jgi:hypothetical protein
LRGRDQSRGSEEYYAGAADEQLSPDGVVHDGAERERECGE